MTSVDSVGNVGLACKATGFMTNDEYIAEAVDRHCFGGHDHIQLLSGRAKSCGKYPPRLVAAILRALRQSMRAAGRGEAQKMMGRDRQLTIAAVEAGPTLEEPQLLSLPDDADGNQEFRDRSTGFPLNPEMVKEARTLEMQYMEELVVLEDSDRDACLAETGRPPIPTDWVDINKGDSLRPNYRSRLVCQETRGRSTTDVEDWAATFAATPPYEAFKLQLSLMMTGPGSQVEGDDDVLMLLDISRAHLHSPLARAVFVTIDGIVYKLLKAVYGLRDAGAAFDRKVLDVMNLMGVSLGKSSICVGHRKAHVTCRDECLSEVNTACLVRMVRLVRWSDDFSLSGRRSLCKAFRDELRKHLLVQTTAVMGPNVEMGHVQEASHVNRLSRLYPPGAGGERWELEADPRHVEILVSQIGLSNESKAVSTPAVRTTDEEDGQELGAEDRACYRSWTMRASYPSQHRCELQFAVKELARRMQQPNTKNMQALERLVRFRVQQAS